MSENGVPTPAADYALLEQAAAQLDGVVAGLEKLAAENPWSELGYFDSAQHEEIEQLFFRFLVSRRVLVELAHRLRPSPPGGGGDGDGDAANDEKVHFADDSEEDLRRTVIALSSALSIFVYEGRFVRAFTIRTDAANAVAKAKLNEEFIRSDIPAGTFERLGLEVTNVERLKSLEAAYLLYASEADDEGTLLGSLLAKSSNDDANDDANANRQKYRHLSDQLAEQVKVADSLVQDLVGKSLLLPSVGTRIRHAKVADLTRHARDETNYTMCLARAHVFKGVSRLKSPKAYLIQFSDEKKRSILDMLQPGDIILTFTAGYVSDVFIPGAFKHGITFVGGPDDRVKAGLVADSVDKLKLRGELPEGEYGRILEQFQLSTLQPSGLDANVIEAVAEGVIFNNIGHLMDTHVNRLLVLRPKITAEERTDALINVFRFLGGRYDFGFNFANASAVVCTEVIYHAFNGKGGLSFELTKRAGHPTLSADDIVNYYLSKPESFDFVLLALEDPKSSQHEAAIMAGDEGKSALAKLMASESA